MCNCRIALCLRGKELDIAGEDRRATDDVVSVLAVSALVELPDVSRVDITVVLSTPSYLSGASPVGGCTASQNAAVEPHQHLEGRLEDGEELPPHHLLSMPCKHLGGELGLDVPVRYPLHLAGEEALLYDDVPRTFVSATALHASGMPTGLVHLEVAARRGHLPVMTHVLLNRASSVVKLKPEESVDVDELLGAVAAVTVVGAVVVFPQTVELAHNLVTWAFRRVGPHPIGEMGLE